VGTSGRPRASQDLRTVLKLNAPVLPSDLRIMHRRAVRSIPDAPGAKL
jgi:hypothetical protein